MEDYTIARDARGNHYLSHGIEWKNHKYIKKLWQGARALYFYTPDELKRYLQNVAKTAQKTGESVKAAGQEVAKKMQIASETTNAVKQKVQEVSQKVQEKAVKEKASKTLGKAAPAFPFTGAVNKLLKKSDARKANKQRNDAGSEKSLFKTAGSNATRSISTVNDSTAESKKEKAYQKASPAEKCDILLSDYEYYQKSTSDIYNTVDAEAKNHLNSELGKKVNGDEKKTEKEDDIDAGAGYQGAPGHEKHISGEAKEGSMKVRRKDGSDPHAEKADEFNMFDDYAFGDYVTAANEKFEELGGMETEEGRAYGAKVAAETCVVIAARTVQSYRDLKKASEQLEQAKQETAAIQKELEALRQKEKSAPGSVTAKEVNWARDKLTSSIENQEQYANGVYDISREIDEYVEFLRTAGETFGEFSDQGWAEVLGIDPRFAGSKR